MKINRLFFLLIAVFIFNSTITFAQKRDLNIVFIGNSITYGAGLPDRATQAPPAICVSYLKLQKKIGQIDFSNQGHSGYTTLDWLPGTHALNAAEDAARAFANKDAQIIFSIKIDTNDSAIKGTHGAPVAVADYRTNLKAIIDQLLKDFPACLVVVQHPIWYSPNTYNGTAYLQEGLTRLQTYIPVMDELVKSYGKTHRKQVFVGDKDAFKYFETHAETDFQHEQGQQGIFYLHPNVQGSAALGEFWGRAITKIVK